HVALDRGDGAVDVGDGLTLGHLTDEHLTGLAERHDRRCGASAFGVRDDGGFATLEDGHHGVRGTQVDSDRSCHGLLLLPRRRFSTTLLWMSLPHSSLRAPVQISKSRGESLSLCGSTMGWADVFPRCCRGGSGIGGLGLAAPPARHWRGRSL